MPNEVAVVGVGLLGSAISEVVRDRGFAVVAWDCRSETLASVSKQGIHAATSLNDAVAGRPWIILSLPTSKEVKQVLAEGAFCSGQVIVDTTTGDPDDVESCENEARRQGIGYIDACVAGSSEALRRRSALLLVGGDPALVEKSRSILDALSERIFHLGPAGSGSRMKLVFNLMLGLERAALAESLAFARAMGIDPNAALEVLQMGATSCPAMTSKGPRMIRREYPPEARLAQHLKDVELILEQARASHAKVPFSDLHRRLLRELVERGFGNEDNAAVIESFLPARN